MDYVNKSVVKKRKNEISRDYREKKKPNIERFFPENVSSEVILDRFYGVIQVLESEGVTCEKVTKLSRCIRKINQFDINTKLELYNVLKVVQMLINSMKNLTWKESDDLDKWKSNVQFVFESCSINMYLIANGAGTEFMDLDETLNDIIYYFRIGLDEMNIKLRESKKSFDKFPLNDLLIEALDSIGELIRIRDFIPSNQTGFITSCIQIIIYQTAMEVQMTALTVIEMLYRKDDEVRMSILNVVVKAICRVSDNYKFVKNYRVRGDLSVSMFTVLIMSLIDNTIAQGIFDTGESVHTAQNLLRESFESLMKISCFLIVSFIRNLPSNMEGNKQYALFLGHLVTELIQISNDPEWAPARLFLNLLAKPLTEIVKLEPHADMNLRTVSIKILSEIIKKKIQDKLEYDPIIKDLSSRIDCDLEDFSRKYVFSYLNRKRCFNRNSKLIHIIQWFDNIRHELNFEEKMLDLQHFLGSTVTAELSHITEPEVNAVVYFLDTVRYNYADYRTLLKYLLWCCNDKNKKIRLVSLQALLELIQIDLELLSDSMVAKIVHESIFLPPSVIKERLCSLIDLYLADHSEKAVDYVPCLIRLLNEPSALIKRIVMDLILKLLLKNPGMESSTVLCHRVLSMIQNEDPTVQNHAMDFCSQLWLTRETFKLSNLDLLLDVSETSNSGKYLRCFFQEKLKPKSVWIMNDTPLEPQSQVVDMCESVTEGILHKMENGERTLQCLRVLSVLVTVHPKAFVSNFTRISVLLKKRKYTESQAVEILTADILSSLLPEMTEREQTTKSCSDLRNDLIDKLNSTDYSMGLMTSLLKLTHNLSNDTEYLFENLFRPNLSIVCNFRKNQDFKRVNRALCIVIYLHIHFKDEFEKFKILEEFIGHPKFGLTTIHTLCYLSMDHKSVLRNETVIETLRNHLGRRESSLMVKAVLYQLSCSLKNIQNNDLESIESVKNVIQMNFRDVIDCTFDERDEIRHAAYSVVRQLLISGLVPETRLLPSILLMTADPNDTISAMGIEFAKQIPAKKFIDFHRNFIKCLVTSQKFRSKYLKCEYVRGYRTRSGLTEAICNYLYVYYQEDPTTRRRIVDSIITELQPESKTSTSEKLFLVDHLAQFTYKYQDEVYYVLWQADVAFSGVMFPAGEPPEETEFVRYNYGSLILTHAKTYLMKHYGLNSEKLRKYSQSDDNKTLVQRKTYVKYEIPEYMTSNDNLAANMYKNMKKKVTEKRKN